MSPLNLKSFPIFSVQGSLACLVNEFFDAQIHFSEGSAASTPVSGLSQRNIQWHGLRHLLTEVRPIT